MIPSYCEGCGWDEALLRVERVTTADIKLGDQVICTQEVCTVKDAKIEDGMEHQRVFLLNDNPNWHAFGEWVFRVLG